MKLFIINRIKRAHKFILVFSFALLSCSKLAAQYDYMFTQYMWNEVYINPAYAGSRDALSIVGLARNQWVGFEGAPITQSITAHTPLFNKRVGVGMSYMSDDIGVSNTQQLSFSYAYRIPLAFGKLAFGLSTAFLFQKEQLSQVKTTDPNDDSFLENTPRIFMPNAGLGLYYYTDKMYVGISTPRILKNAFSKQEAYQVVNKFEGKNLHYYITGGYVYSLSSEVKLKPTAMVKVVYGAPLETDLSLQALFRDMLWVGAAWRTGDAVSFLASVFITPSLRVGYSYDYSFTDIRKVNTGSHEISIGYDISFDKQKVVSPRLF